MRWLLLLGSLSACAASYDRKADPHALTVFMRESGWCWYQGPRAIVQGDQLFIGAVRGNGSGAAQVGVYDLSARKPLGAVVMQDKFDHDDHNSPVFYARPDGSVLAIYARHNRDKAHYYRIAAAGDPLNWSEEMRFTHDYSAAGNVTYMNLYYLAQESTLYNFFRGIQFNPSFIRSADHGKTWGQPTHFIASELNGRPRPYARYARCGCRQRACELY
ncbi:MAG: type IV secretory pathway TrbD component [Rhodothermales bacterium]